MLCRANLGTGRVTGEVVRYNKGDRTVVMRLVGTSAAFMPPGKKGKPIKRHIEKHHVVFEEER